jgi:hypothetical protein
VDPWPLASDRLTASAVAYEAAGYPQALRPLERTFVLQPA